MIAGTGMLMTWDLVTGTSLDLRPKAESTWVVYSADETVLFAGSIDGAVRTFDATSGQEVASVTATEQVYGLTKSPDDRRLAVHTLGAALIWDISPFTGALSELKARARCEVDIELVDGAIRRRTIDVAACNARR